MAFIRCGVSFFYGVSLELFFREKKLFFDTCFFFIFYILVGFLFKLNFYYLIILFFGLIIHFTKNIEPKETYLSRFLLLLGSISYSVYMLQSILIYFFMFTFGSKWDLSQFFIIFIILIIVSYFSYKIIEIKLTKKIKKLLWTI